MCMMRLMFRVGRVVANVCGMTGADTLERSHRCRCGRAQQCAYVGISIARPGCCLQHARLLTLYWHRC
jgi:hypothetical protein